MNNKRLIPFVVIFLIIGIFGLLNFSREVRTVNVVGLFFSGFACSAAIIQFVIAYKSRGKKDKWHD